MTLKLGSGNISKLYVGSTESQKAYLGSTLVFDNAGGTLWTPANLASLEHWYDASDASTITLNGSTISQWDDKSGNNRHATQATGANQPTYTAAGLNGLNVATFSELQWMVFTGTHQATWSAAAVAQANVVNGGIFQFGTVNTFGALFNQSRWRARPAIGGDAVSPSVTLGAPEVLTAVYSTLPDIWVNGTQGTTGSTPSVTATSTSSTLGALSSTIYRLSGFIGEVVVTSQALSTTDRQKLEGYLAHKWQLQASLPSDHPYRHFPPRV